MDDDDLKPPTAGPLRDLEREDLDPFSRSELEDRISRLKLEIKRCEASLDAKGDLKGAAESLFSR